MTRLSIRRLKEKRKLNAVALDEFLVQQTNHWRAQSLWFELPHFEVYLRAGPYVFNGTGMTNTIGVSNVQVYDKSQGRGHFSAFMRYLEKRAKDLGYERIQVEQVLSDTLHKVLPIWGYRCCNDGMAPTYYIEGEELKARAHGCTGGNHGN